MLERGRQRQHAGGVREAWVIRAGFLGFLFGVCKGECKSRLAAGRERRE
jgi:hypothetical protein